jgi:non-specific serine/threonine protein kinase
MSHVSLAQLAGSEAVQLFVERAATALSGFVLTDANALAIAQVCRRLDGIALAIELAAVRVKTLKVEQIASRLDNAFRLLTDGSRTALPRQQTLQATIEWSYNLLSDQERNLLRRLSVFAGGWTLAAAEAVCSGEGVETDEVLDLLTQLVNKSLVISEREQGEEARYRLLETIRQHALERLAESGEGESLRQQHAAFFMRLAEEAEPELRGPNQRLWNERLDREHDNLRTALNWSLEHHVEAGVQLAGNLFWFWHMICYWSEGRAWYGRLLAAGTAPAGPLALSSSARAQALCEAGWLALDDMEIDQALALSDEGLTLYRELGDTNGMAMALNTLGWVAYYQNDYDQARALAEESLARYRELGFKWRMAHLLNLLGNIARARGDIESAIACYQESLTYAREIGDSPGIAYSLYVWGVAAWSQGDRAQAVPLFEESLTLAREIRVEWLAAYSLQTLGDVALAQGDYQRAAALYDECQALWERLGNKRELADLRPSQGWLARLQGNYQRAAALFGEGLRLWQEVGDKRRIAACLEGLAGVAVALDQVERAVRLFGAAEVIREIGGVPLPSVDQATHDHDIAAVRAQLGEADFIALWAEGRAMTNVDTS